MAGLAAMAFGAGLATAAIVLVWLMLDFTDQLRRGHRRHR
jgi:hypothetical protein